MYLTKQPLVKKAALRALGNVAKKGLLVGGLGLGGYGLAKANSNWDHSASYKENASRLLDKLKNFKFSEMLNGLPLAKRLANVPEDFNRALQDAPNDIKAQIARNLYKNSLDAKIDGTYLSPSTKAMFTRDKNVLNYDKLSQAQRLMQADDTLEYELGRPLSDADLAALTPAQHKLFGRKRAGRDIEVNDKLPKWSAPIWQKEEEPLD